MTRLVMVTVAAPLVVVMVLVAAVTGALGGLLGGGGLVPSVRALYQKAAQRCPGLPWALLAAIGAVESDHGRSAASGVHRGANLAGAAGPMQLGIGTGTAGDAFWRFAVDGDHDGHASPYEARLGNDHATTARSRRNLAAVVAVLERREATPHI